ncbi:MAG: M64 family metallopeptidase [Candidatus Diapherotrites archaeon]|nr:M64 family metallopeptidase [Candidatus Diapherotrites archaeon]
MLRKLVLFSFLIFLLGCATPETKDENTLNPVNVQSDLNIENSSNSTQSNTNIIRLTEEQLEQTAVRYCDTDRGNNSYVKGTYDITREKAGRTETLQGEDTCIDSNTLNEIGCSYRGGFTEGIETCKNGCINGACIEDRDPDKCIKLKEGTFSGKKLNIVFVGSSYKDENAFKNAINHTLGIDGQKIGIFSIEPFKSNLNYFDIYYVNEIAGLTEIDPTASMFVAPTEIKFAENCSKKLSDFYIIDLAPELSVTPHATQSNSNLSRPTVITTSLKIGIEGNSICSKKGIVPNSRECDEYMKTFNFENDEDVTLILLHEFGHSFGNFGEEYFSQEMSLGPYSTINLKDNCYTEIRSPAEGKTTIEDCKEKASWKDLIGNGCGQDGIIDCTEQDANQILEVGCYEGCGKEIEGSYRSVLNSVMNQHSESRLKELMPHVFGQANERQLCCQILTQIGEVNGYCNKFNTNGLNLIDYCMNHTIGLTLENQ